MLLNPPRNLQSRPAPGMTRQAGVGLIEVLVSLLVLSIGILGMAALQAMSLATNNTAMARSMSTIATYTIVEAMHADRSHALGGDYNTTVTTADCPAAGSTLATRQLHDWCHELAATLDREDTTTGTIACNDDGACTVTVAFVDTRASAEDQAAQVMTTRVVL